MGVVIGERDQSIFFDIYDFGYVDFTYLRSKYYEHIEKDHVARVAINKRMRTLEEEDFIKRVVFKPLNESIGGSGYVYTLGHNGVRYVKELLEGEADWNKNIAYRKGAFIQHHVSLAHLTRCFEKSFKDMSPMYNGEYFAKYSLPDKDKQYRDLFKPDLIWTVGKEKLGNASYFIEHEKTVNRSLKKMKAKISGHSEYSTSAYYNEHDVLYTHHTKFKPSMIFISDKDRINESYKEVMKSYKWSRTSADKDNNFSDFLFTTTDDFVENPTGPIFSRLYGDKVTLEQSYYSTVFGNSLLEEFSDKQTRLYPGFLSERKMSGKVFVSDGIFQFLIQEHALSFSVHYLSEVNENNISRIAFNYNEFDLKNHSAFQTSIYEDKQNNPKIILIIEDEEQIKQAAGLVKSKDWGEYISSIKIVSRNQIYTGVKDARYYDVFKGEFNGLLE